MDKLFEKCPACQSALRPNAVFCHHCGLPLSNTDLPLQVLDTQSLSIENLPLNEAETVLAKTPPSSKNALPAAEVIEKIENNNGAVIMVDRAATETTIARDEIAAQKNAPVESVSSQPRQRRTSQYVNRTEYVWEEASAPTLRIILFSLLAMFLVILLFWFNSTLR